MFYQPLFFRKEHQELRLEDGYVYQHLHHMQESNHLLFSFHDNN